tara:strand:+ start:480 stop:893 length:414 start_codon:yes stop_codon:yes gene_type:complete
MTLSHSQLSLLRRLALPVALVGVLVWESYFARTAPVGPDIDDFDKFAHFCVFGLLSTLWFRVVGRRSLGWGQMVVAVVLTLLNGFCDEWFQSMNPARSSDAMDWIADALGAITAVFMYRYWDWYRELLERPLWKLLK